MEVNTLLAMFSGAFLLWGFMQRVSPATMRARAARDIARAAHVERMQLAWRQSKRQYQMEVKASMEELAGK